MAVPVILGPDGRPVRREVLTQAVAGPTTSGVRSVLTGYPADGLNPRRVATILREADGGNPLRYLELAELIEERDAHYVGVLGTRKRSVSQVPISVEAASDDPEHVKHADMIRTWLTRDELQDELFDLLDAIGKGFSLVEIIWEVSEGQWQPKALEWRDPRWFEFDRIDGRTPLLRTEAGPVPLDPFKYIVTTIKAKSGLPIRSGLARIAAWSWMFKAFTLRDWAIFVQAYGQPIRIGKYQPSATEAEKDILFRAVANIAGDCAAIIPASMEVEFVEVKKASDNADLYLKRADWLDQQISKAVLGQTATTDAIAGGHAVGQEHRQVQEDIERADCKAQAAALNRDLVRPWVDLQFGPQKAYPRIRIGREDQKDITGTTTALQALVPMGLDVEVSAVRDMLGFPDPAPGAAVLTAPKPPIAPVPAQPGAIPPALQAAFTAGEARAAAPADQDAVDHAITAILSGEGWEAFVAPMIAGLEEQLGAAASLAEAEQILARQLAQMDVGHLGEILARAVFASRLAGETDQALSDRTGG